MRVDLELRGVRHTLDVRRADGEGWVVVMDGRSYRVGVTAAGTRWTLRLAAATAEGDIGAVVRPHDVGFEGGRGPDLVVHVDGGAVPLIVVDPRRARSRRAGSVAATRTVVAPMPGRVVKVLVEPGHRVEARQPLVVIEAMKMQNELRAPQAGLVREVAVVDGQAVDGGAVLVVLE